MNRFSRLLHAEFEASTWDLSSYHITILVCYGILFLSVHTLLRQYFFGLKVPVIARGFFLEPHWLTALRCIRGSSQMIEEGYNKFKDSMFKLRRSDGEIVIIPNKYADQLRNMPNKSISATAAQVKNLFGRYTTTLIVLESNLHTRIVQEKLTPMLGSTIPIVKDELDFAMSIEIPDCQDKWVKVEIYNILLRLVARSSARIFVGPEACRNEEWLAASIHYTENIFTLIAVLRMFPWYLNPLVAPLTPWFWRLRSNLRTAKRIVVPIIRERRAAAAREGADYVKNQDLLQGMMDIASAHENQPENLAHRQLLLTLAAIHSTTMAAVNVIYDLCAHPEYFEPLRDELMTVLREDGAWKRTTLNKLRKLDSFLKESQRFNLPSHLSFNRIVREPIKLYDGTVLPAGTHISMASYFLQQEAANVPGGDPAVFNPFRYSRLREDPAHPENAQKFQFVMTDINNLHFGHGKDSCPGRFFASNEVKMIVSHLLLGYDMKYPDGFGRPKSLLVNEHITPDPSVCLLMRRRNVSDESLSELGFKVQDKSG